MLLLLIEINFMKDRCCKYFPFSQWTNFHNVASPSFQRPVLFAVMNSIRGHPFMTSNGGVGVRLK